MKFDVLKLINYSKKKNKKNIFSNLKKRPLKIFKNRNVK